MNKKLLFSLIFVASITLQGFATPAYASGPTGTVTYNGQNVQVTDGQFTLNGVAGTIDAQGNYSWAGNTGNILSTSGVTGYQITGQAPVAVTPTPNVPAPNTNPVVPNPAKAPSGTVMFNGQAIQVINGQFTLNGVAGTIDAQGNYSWNGQNGNILNLNGVTGYQITGQAPVTVTPIPPKPISNPQDPFTAQQTRDFFATNPNNIQIAAKARELNLTVDQLTRAMLIGRGYDINNMNPSILQSFYFDAAAMLGKTDEISHFYSSSMTGVATAFYSPGLGRTVSAQEMKDFFVTNPTQKQVFQKAYELGVSAGAIYTAAVNAGLLVTAEDIKAFSDNMNASLLKGFDGYATDGNGHIVPLGTPGAVLLKGSLTDHGGPVWIPASATTVSVAPAIPFSTFISRGKSSTSSFLPTISGNTVALPTVAPVANATPGYDSNGNFIGLTAWLRAQNSSTSSSQPSTGNTAQVSDIDPLATSASSCANLTTSLRYGNKDTGTATDVTVLQDFLNSKGYLSIAPTGFFGRLTSNAVKAFQSANNITPSGFVGPITRAKIQSMDCTGTSATTAGANG